MKKVHLEIIATNAESCQIADQNGATRLEVCTALQVGGLTPSLSLVEYAVEFTKCDVAALIRTREGSFHYSQAEIKIMCEDIRRIRDKGAKAVVVGALTSDGFIDYRAIELFVKAARGMDIAFQRAFDVCQDGDEAIGKLESLGICRLLSSGKKSTCVEGLENLKRYAELTTDMEIMPGSGLRSNNIAQVASACFSSYHTSASEMRFENDASIMPASYVVAKAEEVRALSSFLTDNVSQFN